MAVQAKPLSFSAGDVVLSCEPWIWALRWHQYRKVCAYCLTERKRLQKCSGCKLHHYCNRTCQRADWTKEHKQECAILKDIAVEMAADEHQEDPTSNCFAHQDVLTDCVAEILLSKLVNKIKAGAVEELPGLEQLSYRDVLDLFPKNPAYKDTEKALHDSSWRPIASAAASGIPQRTLADCIEVIQYNTFPIMDPDAKWRILGAGLFPHAPHRAMTPVCWDSNVNMGFVGRRLTVHAIADIPSYEGLRDLRYDELAQNHLVTTREERRRSFEIVYGRTCDCLGCTKEYEAEINPLKCCTSGCPARIPSDDRALLPCRDCGAGNGDTLPQVQHFREMYNKIADEDVIDGSKEAAVDTIRKKGRLLTEIDAADILHPDAHIRLVCGWNVAVLKEQEDEYAVSWKLFQELVGCVRNVTPKYHYNRAEYLERAGTCPFVGLDQMLSAGPTPAGMQEEYNRLFAMYSTALPVAHGYFREARDIYVKLCGENSLLAKRMTSILPDEPLDTDEQLE